MTCYCSRIWDLSMGRETSVAWILTWTDKRRTAIFMFYGSLKGQNNFVIPLFIQCSMVIYKALRLPAKIWVNIFDFLFIFAGLWTHIRFVWISVICLFYFSFTNKFKIRWKSSVVYQWLLYDHLHEWGLFTVKDWLRVYDKTYLYWISFLIWFP